MDGGIQIERVGRSNGLRTFILRWCQLGAIAFFQFWGVCIASVIAMLFALVVSVSHVGETILITREGSSHRVENVYFMSESCGIHALFPIVGAWLWVLLVVGVEPHHVTRYIQKHSRRASSESAPTTRTRPRR